MIILCNAFFFCKLYLSIQSTTCYELRAILLYFSWKAWYIHKCFIVIIYCKRLLPLHYYAVSFSFKNCMRTLFVFMKCFLSLFVLLCISPFENNLILIVCNFVSAKKTILFDRSTKQINTH